MAHVLEASNLYISFGAVTPANDVTVMVDEGERLGVIGANGAGKTTFVNMVTGHLKPERGSIRFEGRDITGLPSRSITRLGLCRSFQIAQVFPDLTLEENLLVAIGIADDRERSLWHPFVSTGKVERASQLLDRYGLGELAHRKAGMQPQGVRKLLDIAMATVRSPKLVLLDEPTSGISMDEKFAIMEILMEALAAEHTTVLFVEHDMEIVEKYSNRVIAFYDGRIIADGKPQAVLTDPDVRQYVVGAELHRKPAAAGGQHVEH